MENKELPEGLVEEVARAIWGVKGIPSDQDLAKAALSVIAPYYEKQIAELKEQVEEATRLLDLFIPKPPKE